MNKEGFFTIQIKLNDYNQEGKTIEGKTIELSDHSWEGVKLFHSKVFIQGFRIELNSDQCWELVDPLRIKKILVIRQKGKYDPLS